jgi:succinate dehydrogenase / fumarate reductase cytochrome b subunit
MVRTDVERVDRQHGGMWLWLIQRLTAAFLLFGMLVHIIATHIFAIGELSYENIGERLQSAFFITVDILLLGSVIFHALNGARMVLLDYFFAERSQRRVLDAFLIVFGLAFFVYGIWALWPWITT